MPRHKAEEVEEKHEKKDASPVHEKKHPVEEKAEKPEKEVVLKGDKERIHELEKGLIWLRDNVVHGNEKHVAGIDQILKGE